MIVPLPSLFTHPSRLHGQAHVARVMVHAFRLLDASGRGALSARLWAAVFLHDLARTHDGVCRRHGADAVKRWRTEDVLQAHLAARGVRPDDEGVALAVTVHSMLTDRELPRGHPDWKLMALLKDADGLDRVRLGDLDPTYLRLPETHAMVDFADDLFRETSGRIPEGETHFAHLLTTAGRLLGRPVPVPDVVAAGGCASFRRETL